MPTFFHVGASAMCPHGGQVTAIPTSPRVTVGGQPVTTMSDRPLIAGCAFSTPAGPHPCIKVQWLMPATRVTAGGQPVILQSSSGLCLAPDQAPQGPPTVTVTQLRVSGT